MPSTLSTSPLSERVDSAHESSGHGPIFTAPTSNKLPRPRKRSRVLRKNLRASLGDGAAFSVMVGIGETYLSAFALALGIGEITAGLVASIPLLVGAVLQMVSPYAVSWLKSHQRWVILSVMTQAASFVPLIVAARVGHIPVIALFAIVSVYWGAGMGAGPAWNTWMEAVVPRKVRAPYFAWRTRVSQAGMLVGFVAGGLALQYGRNSGRTLDAFAVIFSIAAVCRFLSARFLSRQSEQRVVRIEQSHINVVDFAKRLWHGRSERMLLYFLAVQVAVQISGPYFTPFMIKQLRFDYVTFMALLAASFAGKILAVPAFGRYAHRFGAHSLVWLGGLGIIPVSGLWLFTDNFAYLLVLQFFGGVVWAAYELAMVLLFFETVQREERTSFLTLFNLANALALVLGSIIGGTLLKILGENPSAYLALFALSTYARAFMLVFLWRVPRQDETLTLPSAEIESQARAELQLGEVRAPTE
ncbi:MAG: MFS transporter [Planctomycetales bacterium]|nr:MFS transporter [Planctomycetales bacterium]